MSHDLTSTQREALLNARTYTRADGKTGRALYHSLTTLRALASRGLVCQIEAVNNGNGRCILTQAGIDLRTRVAAQEPARGA